MRFSTLRSSCHENKRELPEVFILHQYSEPVEKSAAVAYGKELSCSHSGMCLCSKGHAPLVSATTKCTHVPASPAPRALSYECTNIDHRINLYPALYFKAAS